MMYQILSYEMKKNSPRWPNNPTVSYEPVSQIRNGDVSNVYNVTLMNHVGTHMDAPNHYREDGQKITELPLERFIFEKPFLLDIPKGELSKIWKEDLIKYEQELGVCDALLLRSGFSVNREENIEAYEWRGPAVSSEAAEYLVTNFPNLKAVFVDWLSLASIADTADGDEAHRWMLGTYTENFITIVEDVNLRGLPRKIKKVIAMPLMVEHIDSAPVTILAEY